MHTQLCVGESRIELRTLKWVPAGHPFNVNLGSHGCAGLEVLVDLTWLSAISRRLNILGRPLSPRAVSPIPRELTSMWWQHCELPPKWPSWRLAAMCIQDHPTAACTPWQNGHAERLIGSIRRECLDHIVVLRPTPTITTTSGRICLWTKIRRTIGRSNLTDESPRVRFSAHFIISIVGSSFREGQPVRSLWPPTEAGLTSNWS